MGQPLVFYKCALFTVPPVTPRHIEVAARLNECVLALQGLVLAADATDFPQEIRERIEIAWKAIEPVTPEDLAPEGRALFVQTRARLERAAFAVAAGMGVTNESAAFVRGDDRASHSGRS